MPKVKCFCVSLVGVLIVASLWIAPATLISQSATTGSGPTIRGTIKSADGSPMEGVVVSARASNQSWTTSVFSDRQGKYDFPSLNAGEYRIWAQAVGFEGAKAKVTLGGSGQVDQTFSLTPNKDIRQTWKQMSGTEMLYNLPDKTVDDLRGKRLVTNNCTGCHTASWVLQNRFSEQDWGKVVDLMAVYPSHGSIPSREQIDNQARGIQVMRAYRNEIAKYLGRVRGATELSEIKPFARPTGDATQVVITEFDIPRPDNDRAASIQDGTDWSLGTPTRYTGRGLRDLWVAPDGMVWGSDDSTPSRTTAKLDPRTGKVTNYSLKDGNGRSYGTHSIAGDSKGHVWLNSQPNNIFLMFDPKTEQFKPFPRPSDMKEIVGGTVGIDRDGTTAWADSTAGAIKMDVATGKYTYYPARHRGLGYGAAVDRKGNGWATQPGAEQVVKVDAQTGDIAEVRFEPIARPEVLPIDRERTPLLGIGGMDQNSTLPQNKTPRRMSADPSSDAVWVSLYTGNRIARIDINTLAVKEWQLPHDYSMPYGNTTDKNGNVWIHMMNLDRIVKFDPKTEKFTEYKTPTLGSETRHITVDNSTDPPTVWAPYARSNKVARFQFRRGTQ